MHLPHQVYRLCDTLVDDVVCVSDDEIREAIRDGFEDTRALLEPAGALTCSLWLHLLTIGCAYLLWLCLLLMAVLTRRLLGGGTYGYRLPCIRLQARLRSRASRSGQRSSRSFLLSNKWEGSSSFLEILLNTTSLLKRKRSQIGRSILTQKKHRNNYTKSIVVSVFLCLV